MLFQKKDLQVIYNKENKEKGVGLINVSSLAETLHLVIDFMDADGGTNTLGAKSIEVEIHNIYHEMCSKE